MKKLKKMFGKSSSHQSDSSPSSSSAAPTRTAAAATPAAAAPAAAPATTSQTTPEPSSAGAPKSQGVLLTTNYGDITVVMFNDKTPKTCENFTTLADKGYYDGVIFHRIIPDFMIQGGDPTGTGRGGESMWGGKFADEFDRSLSHTGKGILSMANAGPGTNGSQFFITLAPTPHLDGKHSIFGQVVGGMDIVDDIGAAETNDADRPLTDIKIVKARSFVV